MVEEPAASQKVHLSKFRKMSYMCTSVNENNIYDHLMCLGASLAKTLSKPECCRKSTKSPVKT